MKINITKEQYKNLIKGIAIANSVMGILGDAVSEEEYKSQSDDLEELENYLLQYADDFGCREFVQYDGECVILDDEFYEDKIMSIMGDYEEYIAYDFFANELAWRDFKRDYSEEEIKKMAEKNGDYFGVELYDYEKKYWDEFEENGVERVDVKK